MEVLLIGVKNPIHLSEAGGDTENVVEDEEVVKTRRCQPLLPLGTSTVVGLNENITPSAPN